MKAQRIMTLKVTCVAPELPLDRAFALMQKLGVRHLPVVAHGQLYGIVSDRDLLVRGSLNDEGKVVLPPRTVGEATSFHPITCGPSTPVGRIASLMIQHKIDALPITDPHGKLVGLVTSTDLLRLLESNDDPESATLPFSFELSSETSLPQ